MDTERTKKARKENDGNSLAILGIILGTGIGAAAALIYRNCVKQELGHAPTTEKGN